MTTRNFYKCFISSPGDCNKEREICEKVINDLNNGLAKHLNVNFETFMWEYDVLPDMGKNGQEIIDEHIDNSNYDLFIGIMKNRYGQPTKKAGSGTEHELNDALKKKEVDKEDPQILFFFGKEMIDPDNFDSEQYSKVKEFKKRVRDLGIYTDFDDIDNFEKSLRQKLELYIKKKSPINNAKEKVDQVDNILKRLEFDLEESLKAYNEKAPIWIDPIISSRKDIPNDPSKNSEFRIDVNSIISNPQNIVIKAPSEFGLTSLAHYLKLCSWKEGKSFLYIDAKQTKKHKVVKDLANEAKNYYFKNIEDIDCILLDSVCFEENGSMQLVKNICDEYIDIPLVIFNTLDDNFFIKSDDDDQVKITREFISYYLLPLPQNEIRKVVTTYSNSKMLSEDSEVILSKLTKDLEVLNMHRTVKNCISILRAGSKMGNDYNPINRTKLLETILNGIFQDYELPTYQDKKPDVKDCTFVLGYLCESLVLRNEFEFTDDYFIKTLNEFCSKNFIELDLNYLLKILKDNSIIANNAFGVNYFKNSYWVFFFIAHRMEMNSDFKENIYSNKKYIDYPEIIEFYTGINRNKEDALIVLSKDLDETLLEVRTKVNIPNNLNPFTSINWKPDISILEKEEAKIGENVISSGLPDEVKDKYDDKNYDQTRPYNQIINSVMREYSFMVLMRQISATSKALRNSDFVANVELKKDLLNKITEAWNEINKLLIILSPLLADKGNVAFEGANFYLDEDDFNFDDPIQKRMAVLTSVPTNIVKFFKDDLYSSKIAPLLIDKAINEKNSLIKHELMLLIIAERPYKWREIIDNYIVSLDKNSFFLSDTLSVINFNIDFKATEISDVQILKFLAKKCIAKHIYNSKNPDLGLIKKVK